MEILGRLTTYDVKFKIRKKHLTHLVHIIRNLHKVAILGIDFIHSQNTEASPGEPWWQSGHAKRDQVGPMFIIKVHLHHRGRWLAITNLTSSESYTGLKK
jgi:hypothetical protein